MRSSLRTASAAVPLPFPAGEQVVAQICAIVHRRRLHSSHTPLAIDCPRASPFSASYSRPLHVTMLSTTSDIASSPSRYTKS
uniref:Uncharacterized protein n=1 Tax=Zea mays TaxID=4577 RepID=B6SKB9_MAIZE|nr:hypothetical protein [Zea mays]